MLLGNGSDDAYEIHDDLLPDDIIRFGDDRDDAMFLGPTESAKIRRMRNKLNDLNYAQVRYSKQPVPKK